MNNREMAGRVATYWGRLSGVYAVLLMLSMAQPSGAQQIEYLPGIDWPEPAIVAPGPANNDPPSDAIVLFDGRDLSAWENGEKWKVEDGVAIVGEGYISTKQEFGDCQLHVEWSAPVPATGEGQGRGNSGVFLMSTYELQVLDSYDSKTYPDGQAGAIYKQTPPMANAMRPPGEWNAYDVVFTAPRFAADGSLQSPAFVTALHNGVLILNHFEIQGDTPWHRPAEYRAHPEKMPISIQDHGNPIRFRNIWLREIKPIVGTPREAKYLDHASGKKWLANQTDAEGNPLDE